MNNEIARLTLLQQFPNLEIGSLEHIGSGWEFDVYLVDGALVVRFPRYGAVAGGLDRAERLLEFVHGEVDGHFGVPRITLHGEPGPHFPHPFFGHDFIPGIPTSKLAGEPSPDLTSDLGKALSLIHGITPDVSAELSLRPQKWNCRSAFEALTATFRDSPELGEAVPEAREWADEVSTIPAEYSGPQRFIHDDLQPEHIVVDPASGRLSGIIDWGPAMGDPAQDFSFLVAWGSWEFASRVVEEYTGLLDPDFTERLLFLGRVRAIGWLMYEIAMNLDTRRTRGIVHDLLELRSPS